MDRLRLVSLLAGGAGIVVLVALLLVPRAAPPGTVAVILASASADTLAPVPVRVGDHSLTAGGAVPALPGTRTLVQLVLPPGTYPVRVAGALLPGGLAVTAGQVQPILIAVRDGQVVPGGVYAGGGNVNLGLQELSGKLKPLPDVHLVDQDGRTLDRAALLGGDTVIAAFHTTCHESCPLYTGLLFQVRRSAPDVHLVEVTTDPATDTPSALAAYRAAIGASWTFATGQADDLAEFWGPLGVSLAVGDTHSSALVLVDRYGYIRAGFTGVPDVGGTLPGPLDRQLDAPGRSLLAGHGEGWGAPQVVDSLRTLAAAGRSPDGARPPAFTLAGPDGTRTSLEELGGRPIVINFGWSGCLGCRQEAPLLQRTADGRPDVAMVLVDPADSAGAARAFAAGLHLRMPVLLDEGGRVAAAYGVAWYPTTFFVRADGTVASHYTGELTPDVLSAHLSNLGGG